MGARTSAARARRLPTVQRPAEARGRCDHRRAARTRHRAQDRLRRRAARRRARRGRGRDRGAEEPFGWGDRDALGLAARGGRAGNRRLRRSRSGSEGADRRRVARGAARSSAISATASTTHPLCMRPTSASPSTARSTSRARRRTSCCSSKTSTCCAAEWSRGGKTFANTLKYLTITTSANFGNMLSMAAGHPKVVGRLRPDPPLCRLGRHARRDHRDPPSSVRHARSDLVCGVRVSDHRAGGQHGHPTIQSGIPVARIELLDEVQMDAQ